MRYIEKRETPQYFIEEVKLLELELTRNQKRREVFDKLNCKKDLHHYLLTKEQNGICGYCEAYINEFVPSHIEHIEALNRNINLVFDYSNLIVSCDGLCFTDENKRLTCGHKKDTKGYKVNYSLFLSPTKVKNIRDYFKYTDNFNIGATNLNPKKAKETIRVLNLGDHNNELQEARKKAFEEFKMSIKNYAEKRKKPLTSELRNKIIQFLLSKENLAFISFLKYKFK